MATVVSGSPPVLPDLGASQWWAEEPEGATMTLGPYVPPGFGAVVARPAGRTPRARPLQREGTGGNVRQLGHDGASVAEIMLELGCDPQGVEEGGEEGAMGTKRAARQVRYSRFQAERDVARFGTEGASFAPVISGVIPHPAFDGAETLPMYYMGPVPPEITLPLPPRDIGAWHPIRRPLRRVDAVGVEWGLERTGDLEAILGRMGVPFSPYEFYNSGKGSIMEYCARVGVAETHMTELTAWWDEEFRRRSAARLRRIPACVVCPRPDCGEIYRAVEVAEWKTRMSGRHLGHWKGRGGKKKKPTEGASTS